VRFFYLEEKNAPINFYGYLTLSKMSNMNKKRRKTSRIFRLNTAVGQ